MIPVMIKGKSYKNLFNKQAIKFKVYKNCQEVCQL